MEKIINSLFTIINNFIFTKPKNNTYLIDDDIDDIEKNIDYYEIPDNDDNDDNDDENKELFNYLFEYENNSLII